MAALPLHNPWFGPFSKLLLVLLIGAGCNRTPEPPPPSATQAVASPPPSNAVPAPPDVGAPPPDANKTSSGLAYKVLQPGVGKEHPLPRAQVTIHYTGWTAAGRMIDSTSTRKEPAVWRLDEVIKGWREGLQLMTKGQAIRLWIPADLAYGEKGRRKLPGGNLVYDMELVDFIQPPLAPPDVTAPPPNVKRTDSGLAYRVLRKGKGTQHPTGSSGVRVDYSGWTTDGDVFDSTLLSGQPTVLQLDRTIAGLSEGLQLMVEGEKTRLWIPLELAYGDNPPPGRPSGMLVYDVELLGIE